MVTELSGACFICVELKKQELFCRHVRVGQKAHMFLALLRVRGGVIQLICSAIQDCCLDVINALR